MWITLRHMSEFLETIRVSEGRFMLLPLHAERMSRTQTEAYGRPNCGLCPSMADVPVDMRTGEVKCRVRYGREIEAVEFERYSPRTVRSLRLVEASADLDYHLKYADRSALTALRAQRGDADDVVIVCQGLVTDTSYSNLVFRSREGRLYTPRTPLLRGVMRRHLLEKGLLSEADITLADLQGFVSVMMINAMMPPGAIPEIPATAIGGDAYRW